MLWKLLLGTLKAARKKYVLRRHQKDLSMSDEWAVSKEFQTVLEQLHRNSIIVNQITSQYFSTI